MSTDNIDGKYVRLPSGTRIRNLKTGKPLRSPSWDVKHEFKGTAKRAIVPVCEDPSLVWFRIYDGRGIESCGYAVLAEDLEVVDKSDLVDRIESYGFECEAGPLSDCVEWRALVAQYRRFQTIVLGPNR